MYSDSEMTAANIITDMRTTMRHTDTTCSSISSIHRTSVNMTNKQTNLLTTFVFLVVIAIQHQQAFLQRTYHFLRTFLSTSKTTHLLQLCWNSRRTCADTIQPLTHCLHKSMSAIRLCSVGGSSWNSCRNQFLLGWDERSIRTHVLGCEKWQLQEHGNLVKRSTLTIITTYHPTHNRSLRDDG